MPMLILGKPLRAAILPSSAKCRAGSSSTGGMHINPTTGSLWMSRQGATKGSKSGGRPPRLLRLFAGIDLDEAGRPAADMGHFLGECRRDPLAIDRLDDIEQHHRVPGLVGLQRSDQVQFDVGTGGLERRELLLRFLDAVLAEHALTGLEHLADAVGAMGLGDGDQGDVRRIAAGTSGGGLDSPANFGQAVGARAHVPVPHASRPVRAARASALSGLAARAASRVSRALSRSPSTTRQAPYF